MTVVASQEGDWWTGVWSQGWGKMDSLGPRRQTLGIADSAPQGAEPGGRRLGEAPSSSLPAQLPQGQRKEKRWHRLE